MHFFEERGYFGWTSQLQCGDCWLRSAFKVEVRLGFRLGLGFSFDGSVKELIRVISGQFTYS